MSAEQPTLPGFDPPPVREMARPLPDRRFPLEPLAAVLGIRLVSPETSTGPRPDPEVGSRQLAERIDVPFRTVVRWRAEGIPLWRYVDGRTVDMPDYLAVTYAGMHPCLIWPEWLESIEDDDDGG